MEINTLYKLLDLDSKGDSLDQSRSNTQSFIKKAFQDEELEDLNLKGVLQHFCLLKTDLQSMFALKLARQPETVFFFHEPALVASLCETKEVMIGRNIKETLDIFISMLDKNIENMIDEDTDEDSELPEVLYEKKIGSSGEVTFFANGKPLTTALIEEDLMKEVERFVDLLTHERRFLLEDFASYYDNDVFFSIELDTNFGGCRSHSGGRDSKTANCFYFKKIHINEIENLSRIEIVEFIKKDLKHLKVEDLDLPWIEIK